MDASALDPESTANEPPPKRPRGAPVGSKNALRHGKRTQEFRFGLALGALPKGAIHIERAGKKFRQYLEAAIIDAHGEVTVERAAVVHACVNWMQAEALAWLWLRKHSGDKKNPMSHSERLAYVQACAKASSEVVRHIAMLRLNPVVAGDASRVAESLYDKSKTLLGAVCEDADEDRHDDDTDHDTDSTAGSVANNPAGPDHDPAGPDTQPQATDSGSPPQPQPEPGLVDSVQ